MIYRLHREKIHLHVHEDDGQRHLHAHNHAHHHAHHHAAGKMAPDQLSHAATPHHHKHPKKHFGALCVGVMHGAAGTGGLMVLAVTATQSIVVTGVSCDILRRQFIGDDAVNHGGILTIHAHRHLGDTV